METYIVSTRSLNFQTFSNFREERGNMNKAFQNFLTDLIIENAVDKNEYFSLFVSDLDHATKKLFLSYIVDAEHYDDLTANLYRELEAIKEYEQDMQYIIDQYIDDVYNDYRNSKKENADGYDACEITSLT